MTEPRHAPATKRSTKRVVSVSLGSSRRDATIATELLGQRILLERRGTDGDRKRAAQLISELDGQVDAIGLGGIDLFIVAAGRRYYFREALELARHARVTPVVCGAGLKDSLERVVVERLDERIGWRDRRVLMVAAVDRFGMAEALASHGARMRYGDLMFGLGVPLPLDDIRHLNLAARLFLPVVTKFPVSWVYPTGGNQDGEAKRDRGKERHFAWAEVIAGDFHWIRRYSPGRLDGKIILTNTTTGDDVEAMRARGVEMLVTTTPRFDGRSLSTNLLEAALVAVAGRHPLSAADYRALVLESGLEPDVQLLGSDRRRREPEDGRGDRTG